MRNANTLNVDVHTRALRAADRVSSNGRMQGINHAPEDVASRLARWANNYFRWESLTVAGREVKGFIVSPLLAGVITTALGVLLAACITVTTTVYWRMSDKVDSQATVIGKQNELLIRLDQRLMDKGQHDSQEFDKLDERFQSVEAWQQVTNKEIAKLQMARGIK